MNEQPDPDIDNTFVFKQLWQIINDLQLRLQTRFQLNRESGFQDLHEYSSYDGNFKGSLDTYSGTEIEWLVHTWLRSSAESNFSTMRLTVWLRSHIQVPHLTFEFGTVPNVFFYIDYIPRTELLTNLEYLDHYYEPVNEIYLRLLNNKRLTAFTSKSVYIRQFQSPISLCYTCSATEENLELIRTVSNEMLGRWLTWVDEAQPVPEDARIALIDRDLFVRRTSAEGDPGNKLTVQMFGTELTNRLVRALWGG